MGILNVTPDSFSDGGCFLHTEEAVRRGLEMAEPTLANDQDAAVNGRGIGNALLEVEKDL